MLNKLLLMLLLSTATLFSGEINIAVAADMTYKIKVLIKEFKKQHPDINVNPMLGSGSNIMLLIKKGAPFELFMSDNSGNLNKLYKEEMAVTKPKAYALDELVIYSKNKRDFSKGISLLKDKTISKIVIIDPNISNYGKSALEAIKRKNIYEDVKDKLVYFRPITQSLSYNLSKDEVGIISKATLHSPHMSKYKKGKNWTEINMFLFTPIDQSVVILKSGENNKEVKEFYDFLFSKNARKIFKKFGYTVD